MISRLLLLVFFLGVGAIAAQAQKKVNLTAKGMYISRDLTPEQTKRKAIEEAKREALNKAGVSETIQVSDFLYQFEDNEKFQEIFQGFTSTETGGEVMVNEIISETKNFDEDGNMIVEVEIDATVFIHKEESDKSFRFTVKGIDEFYDAGEFMRFEFTPLKDGYLKIFNVTEVGADILYPYKNMANPMLNEQQDKLFEKGKKYDFPISDLFDEKGYELVFETPGKDKEFNLLIFVFVKKDYPFLEQPSVNSIMNWIYSIPADERMVEQHGFVIRKN